MTSLWWIRRDARLHDNPALLEALHDGPAAAVYPWSDANDAWSGRRRAHLARVLTSLADDTDGAIGVRRGTAADVVAATADQHGADVVWAQQEFSPSAIAEQDAVRAALEADGRELRFVGSPYAVAPGRVLKPDGTDYQVYTPFMKAWRDHGWRAPAEAADPAGLKHVSSDVELGELAAAGDEEDPLDEAMPHTEADALRMLDDFIRDDVERYAKDRDRPDIDATSHLSVPLAFGQIHPRTLLAAAAEAGGDSARKFGNEVAWREFHADTLFHAPHARRTSLRAVIPDDAWAAGKAADEAYERWQQGTTGFPLVDAGMRELAATGSMHNRVRMVVASFLIKDLHIRWQRGADHFRRALLDYDHAQNQLNWQWVAGTGRDAAPYFRIFNPDGQAEKFDPDRRYVRRWIPELDTDDYPERMVDHKAEREVSLADFQRAKRS